ncbi:MAG TPA: glycosyltransferase [Rhabdochlamydiaceae bacterium]|nr:glycosyltransferase [Rhabdochlamydiaceae bacterium]
MRTAVVHDWLITMGGAEKTLQSILELYPSPIYTLIADRKRLTGTVFSDKEIHSSFVQKFPFASKLYRNYLPFFPLAIEQFDLSDFDVILSSSHTTAKGVIIRPDQLHICYCHTPIRCAWDLYHQSIEGLDVTRRTIAKSIFHYIRNWDIASLSRVDHFIANSRYVAQRIKRHYNREATVIHPPVAVDLIPFREDKETFYLTLSRLVPYKKIDLIVEAFGRMPEKKLIVIGDGPEMSKIKSKAKKNVEILGYQPDSVVRDYLSKAQAFVFAALEDFGIAAVEAQAAGTPVIAFGKGGVLETVVENVTGTFFPDQTSASMMEAIKDFEKRRDQFDPHTIKRHSQQFSESRFAFEFKRFVEQKIQEFYESSYSGRR